VGLTGGAEEVTGGAGVMLDVDVDDELQAARAKIVTADTANAVR
jgi:hypothetical protein